MSIKTLFIENSDLEFNELDAAASVNPEETGFIRLEASTTPNNPKKNELVRFETETSVKSETASSNKSKEKKSVSSVKLIEDIPEDIPYLGEQIKYCDHFIHKIFEQSNHNDLMKCIAQTSIRDERFHIQQQKKGYVLSKSKILLKGQRKTNRIIKNCEKIIKEYGITIDDVKNNGILKKIGNKIVNLPSGTICVIILILLHIVEPYNITPQKRNRKKHHHRHHHSHHHTKPPRKRLHPCEDSDDDDDDEDAAAEVKPPRKRLHLCEDDDDD